MVLKFGTVAALAALGLCADTKKPEPPPAKKAIAAVHPSSHPVQKRTRSGKYQSLVGLQ